MASPFDQFILKPLLEISLFGYDISITNASASVLIVAVFLSLFCIILSYCINVYPSAMQVAVERVYLLVKNMVDGMIGEKGRGLLPLLFSIFIMIMFMNLFGIIPYNFTPTSHLVFNLIISFSFMTFITLYGIYLHGLHFITLFIPGGIPMIMVPFIAFIEMVSYCIRPFSLAIRLTANMTIGHIILKLVAKLILVILQGSVLNVFLALLSIPIFIILLIVLLQESFVALLQSYVFVLLSCIYSKDAVKLH